MKVLGGMNAHLQSAGNQVLAHLQDAFFHLGRILGIHNVFLESFVIDFLGFFGICQHEQGFIMFTENIVDVDTDQYLDFGNIAQFLP